MIALYLTLTFAAGAFAMYFIREVSAYGVKALLPRRKPKQKLGIEFEATSMRAA